MTFIYEEFEKENKLNVDQQEYLVEKIVKSFDKFDEHRQENLQAALEVKNALIPDMKAKGDIKIPEVYETRETYKAHLWKSWFSNIENMFDVQGKTKRDHASAKAQKSALVNVFKNANLVEALEKGLNSWIDKGEFIGFVNWKKIIKERRKQHLEILSIENNGEVYQKSVPAFSVVEDVEYDGPEVTVVAPENFVFDSSKFANFDSCPKIYRSYQTYDEISSNQLFEGFEGLEQSKQPSVKSSKARQGDMIEVLEYWGDITLENGTLLKNYVITVANRDRVLRFEKNPFILNPFVFASFLENPTNKRGISPLFVALPLNKISTTILNLQLDALKLIINKPYLAPKGSLSGKIEVKEGSIIEYDPALMPQTPIPLDFKDALTGWDFLKFFESKIESATGVFKYMTGEEGNNTKTATEANGLMQSQNIRLSKEVDMLNLKVKLPIIKKVAEMLANFAFEVQEIRITSLSGEVDFISIDENVRQGKYDYIVADSSSVLEKKSRLNECIALLRELGKNPELNAKINWVEVTKWAFDQLGSVDASIFINHAD